MVNHVKGKRKQREYGEALIKRLTEKLMQGWNPWIEIVQPLEYSSFDDVCIKYEAYLMKLLKEHNMREDSVVSYCSRIKMLKEWKKKQSINLYYTYQFDSKMVGQFLEYVFADRNNTLRTRNNYLSWLKTTDVIGCCSMATAATITHKDTRLTRITKRRVTENSQIRL